MPRFPNASIVLRAARFRTRKQAFVRNVPKPKRTRGGCYGRKRLGNLPRSGRWAVPQSHGTNSVRNAAGMCIFERKSATAATRLVARLQHPVRTRVMRGGECRVRFQTPPLPIPRLDTHVIVWFMLRASVIAYSITFLTRAMCSSCPVVTMSGSGSTMLSTADWSFRRSTNRFPSTFAARPELSLISPSRIG